MGENDFVLDGMRWSYSSVNAYNTCPKMFKLTYIDCVPKVENAFGQWGTFMHALLEKYFKHEIEFFELSQLYLDGYKENVTCPFPPNNWVDLSQKYYERGKEFCDNFDGDFEEYEVVGVEERVKLDINGRPFVGVIDLVLRDKDGCTHLIDHKSKGKFSGVAEKNEYLRQLYLYALHCKEKYGTYPSTLTFNMIRAGGRVVEEFDEQKCNEAVEWFVSTIDKIYADTNFEPNHSEFFCNAICSTRFSCKNSNCYEGD